MKFSAITLDAGSTDPGKLKADCIVVAGFSEGIFSDQAEALLEKHSATSLTALYKSGDFTGSKGQAVLLYQPGDKTKKIVLLGLGERAKVNPDSFRKSLADLAKTLTKFQHREVLMLLDEVNVDDWDTEDKARATAQAMEYARYKFTRCKSNRNRKSDKKSINRIVYGCTNGATEESARNGLIVGQAVAAAMNVARELGNLPGNICTPRYLASEARKLANGSKRLQTRILSEKDMKELGMDALLSVSTGSQQPAQLIVMEYQGTAKTAKPHVLIGKGITFDTGGISLKPGAAMDEMKFDMCGAASVFGVFHALVTLKPAINVVSIVAAAENMPDGRATKPGDVVTSLSGQTIEILNTDAEGRLVLCDALTYAERFEPASVIDIATLTGACVVALGKHATGLFSNNDDFARVLLQCGHTSGDRAWQLPLWDDYQTELDSNFADMANIGSRYGGSITAACFLSRFADKFPRWAHLDIAGTAWHSGKNKGATGRPVPLLLDYLLNVEHPSGTAT